MDDMLSENYHFKTHSDLKDIIGQDLINDDNIAIIELVKNGIDAQAKDIKIIFNEDSIVISDNGNGMSLFDLENKWLNIAYSEKKEKKSGMSFLAGNKGVGRFACDRLGHKLDLFTLKENSDPLHLSLNWSDFEGRKDYNAIIQAIDIEVVKTSIEYIERETGLKLEKHGTILLVTEPKLYWARDKLLSLKRQLQKFVNPIAVFDSSMVTIDLIAKHEIKADFSSEPHEKINGIIENAVFERLKFKTTYIESVVNNDGSEITTVLYHEGEVIYKLVEKNIVYEKLKNTSITIHFMSQYKKSYFKRQTGINVVDFGSIFLFINGYRVSPYGDRDNDWLQLNSRKAQGVRRYFGSRDVLGVVNIFDHDGEFRIVSNREGVARNEAFSQLTNKPGGFIYNALVRLEKFSIDGLGWDQISDEVRLKLLSDSEVSELEVYTESLESKTRRIALDLLRIVDASPSTTISLYIAPHILNALSREKEESVNDILNKFLSFDGEVVSHDVKLALNKIHSEFQKQKENLKKAKKTIAIKNKHVTKLVEVARNLSIDNKKLETEIKTQQKEILFSRLSSTTDQEQLLLLHHQSKLKANTVKNYIDRALNELSSGGDKDKLFAFLEKALINTKKLIAVSNFATKANFKLKTETINADIATFIQEYIENVASENSAQNLNIKVTRKFDTPFVTKFKPIDIAIIFDNLASNSSRAKAKNFLVELLLPSENQMEIIVYDDGHGLSKEIVPEKAIFDKGVTSTSGSGLGLYHVKQTIEQMNGAIDLIDSNNTGFCLSLRIFK
ncbi:ATP-binding protein [Dickeya chrysanthemi]|uniref:sensor histidine kinase n=1 Tax=Dickeya chrysanthemi TaxID=556 RepID=UPI001CF46C18|nr:ATP-binding protein [Dickeya chrysanthemi]MCA7006069.1 ATP-binding protein [Dickeya chrysanthemi]